MEMTTSNQTSSLLSLKHYARTCRSCDAAFDPLDDEASTHKCRLCRSKDRPLALVVDDDAEIREAIAYTLIQMNFDVLEASTGTEGLAMARRQHPAVVFTDALMPGMDGREMCRLIKADPTLASTKVVVMTSLYRSVRYRNEAHRMFKADEYLLKPLSLGELGDLAYSLLPKRSVA